MRNVGTGIRESERDVGTGIRDTERDEETGIREGVVIKIKFVCHKSLYYMVTRRYATRLDTASPRSNGTPNKNPSIWYCIPL